MDQIQPGIGGPLSVMLGQWSGTRLGDTGEQVVTQLFGKYAELTRRGMVYAARTAAAAAVPVHTTMTNGPTLWNKASSGKLVYPLMLLLSPAAIGTPVLQGFGLGWLKNTGDNVGTGAPIVTATLVAPSPCLIGRGACSTAYAPAVVTFTTQPAVLMDLGVGHWLEGAAASGSPVGGFLFDFDGSVVMPPGTSITLCSNTTATSTTYWSTILFAEVPLPPLWV